MAGREVREYTNLSDPKDKKWGKGKDKIDDEDITFQRMVAKWDSNFRISFLAMLHVMVTSNEHLSMKLGVMDGLLYLSEESILGILASCIGWLMQADARALDSDDLLYLKEQMEAEEDAERLLRRTEKRAFAAFKISFCVNLLVKPWLVHMSVHRVRSVHSQFSIAASLADSSPASVPLAFRVEPKPKSGIRQQDLLKKVVEIKPKRPRSDANRKPDHDPSKEKEQSLPRTKKVEEQPLSGSKKAEEHAPLGSQEAEAKPKVESSSGGLLGLAYDSSDDDE
ncbi:hypothetical protein JHK87_025265 [Glycine soja]|nr:hypothetical protein JHK87_025265 [Glycine soja]